MSKAEQTPSRYVPDEQKWRKKDWLYEQYWGQMRSLSDIASDTNVGSDAIRCQMERFGIPRRWTGWKAQREEYDPRQEWWLDEDELVNRSDPET